MPETSHTDLQQKVEQLLDYCQHLQLQNQQLQQQNRQLSRREQSLKLERNRLLQNRDKTQKRVEAMIGRLKALES